MPQPDVVIAGAGLIGLSCALELRALGMSVTVLERGAATRQASSAAAGMLAARDPQNPAALSALAELSISLYSAFLERIAALSGMRIPIQTEWTLEPDHPNDATPQHDLPQLQHDLPQLQHDLPQLQHDGFVRIAERSLDPRNLVRATLAAARGAGIEVIEDSQATCSSADAYGVTIKTAIASFRAAYFLDCTGAWSPSGAKPTKGQMLRVAAPGALTSAALGNVVVRTPQIYMVPRLDGTVVIGATVEDAGFDMTNHDADLSDLREKAAVLIPAMAEAPEVERWAGLRPDTPDHLPLMGKSGESCFVATGHFRNGILLAPATAHLLAQCIQGQQPSIDLAAFAPNRFR